MDDTSVDTSQKPAELSLEQLRKLESRFKVIQESLFWGDTSGACEMTEEIVADPMAGQFRVYAQRYLDAMDTGLHPDPKSIITRTLEAIRQKIDETRKASQPADKESTAKVVGTTAQRLIRLLTPGTGGRTGRPRL